MSKKSKIKLISSLITLCLTFSMFIFSTVTFAWLSANRKAEADQVEMQVDTYSNLVISDDSSEIQGADYTEMVVTYTTNDTKYAPCTHDGADGYKTEELKYITNLTEIDRTTGYKKTNGADLIYAKAANSTTGGTQYYLEKTVYLASNSKEIESATLTGEIMSATKDVSGVATNISSGTLMATSVDFYLVSGGTATYMGTSNVATKNKVSLFGVDGSSKNVADEIPLNTEGYITVLMRFYFDGALESSTSGTAYVNTATLDLSKVTINVLFEAIDSTT